MLQGAIIHTGAIVLARLYNVARSNGEVAVKAEGGCIRTDLRYENRWRFMH